MWELDHKESWVPKNWCFWTVVLEKSLESSLDCKEIKPVNLKGNQSWIFIGRTDAEAESPILWPPAVKNWLLGKELDAGKDWRQEEKGTIEDEMVGWHHRLDGHEFEQALGVGKGQGRKPGMLQSMGLQTVGHNWVTELNWTEYSFWNAHGWHWREFPDGSDDKESSCNAGDPCLIPGLGRSPGEENGSPLQYFCLENSRHRGSWQAIVHGVTKSQTGLSDYHSLTWEDRSFGVPERGRIDHRYRKDDF